MGVGSGWQGGGGCVAVATLWIFIPGTVDSGLTVLFFGLLFRCPPSWKRINSAIFPSFLLFSVFFSFFPLEIFCQRPCVYHTNDRSL